MLNKPADDYYRDFRSDILPLLPKFSSRVLDVGCANGVTGGYLKKNKLAAEVFGVEMNPHAAEQAQTVLDKVVQQDLNKNPSLPFEDASFDTILCLDVLEHLIDPWSTLQHLKGFLKKEGRIIVSLPNVQHFRTSLRLAFCGEWKYQDAGTLDITHLRFFTFRSAQELAVKSGYRVEKIIASNRMEGPKAKFLKRISLGLLDPLLDYQYLLDIRQV